MNKEQIKSLYSEVYKEIKNEGYSEGINNEKLRVHGLLDLIEPSNKDLLLQAVKNTNYSAKDITSMPYASNINNDLAAMALANTMNRSRRIYICLKERLCKKQ